MQQPNLTGLAMGFPAFGLLLGNIYFSMVLFLHHSCAIWRPLLDRRERMKLLPLFVTTQNLAHGGI